MSLKGSITEKTKEKLRRVERLTSSGVSFTEACRIVGINRSHYRRVERKLSGEKND